MLLLMLAGLAAGWIDAVVGGGGLISGPRWCSACPGRRPFTSWPQTAGLLCGPRSGSVTCYRWVQPDLRTAVPMALVAFLGALGGAVLASRLPKAAFNPILLVVSSRSAPARCSGRAGLAHEPAFAGHHHTLAAVGAGLVIGYLDGALGRGAGSSSSSPSSGSWATPSWRRHQGQDRRLRHNLAALVISSRRER